MGVFSPLQRIPISHKVIEKRRRDRINRCLNELGKTVPMALAKQSSGKLSFDTFQSSGKLEKAEILEMTVQYLRALHSADFPRGREKVERMETKDTKYARILAFLQSKARFVTEPIFTSLGSLPEPDFSYQLPPAPDCLGHSTNDPVFQQGSGHGHFSWHGSARNPGLPYLPNPAMPLSSPGQQRSTFLSSVQGLDRHYLNLIGHSHPNTFSLPTGHQHPSVL
ncbi:hypothetical protein JRQ81_016527 [Phrynocephalus forsythii]|uniref:Hairy and enhancer of split-related protein HELT n=1 Tax=Phrynocephalus forsythii TaxID=171643 RepID=A0A9Q1B0Z7_9SAUR|nr:hypothetical protein JRQ81_016527 [Phrynocephalus forsythii]